MPVISPEAARDEIGTLVKTAYDANIVAAGGTLANLFWEGVKGDPISDPQAGKPADAEDWTRVQIRHSARTQATLNADLDGQRRFRADGLITVQIFAPFGDGLLLADRIARILLDAFEGQTTPGGVWFRDVRGPIEVGQDGPWFQVNVLAPFQYDTVK